LIRAHFPIHGQERLHEWEKILITDDDPRLLLALPIRLRAHDYGITSAPHAALPSGHLQARHRLLEMPRYDSSDSARGAGLGCFRALLWSLILEAVIILGVMLIRHWYSLGHWLGLHVALAR
jgi:hypothetical protein